MPATTTFKKKSQNNDNLIAFWRENPVQAARDIFGAVDPDFDLDMPQQVVLNSRWTHDYEIDILGRGSGKTFINAVTAWLQAMLYPGQRVGLIAPSFRQSKFMWGEIERLYEMSPLVQECVSTGPSITPEKCYVKLEGSEYKIGSMIEALPMGTDGQKIRGARYYFVLADELAQIEEETLDVVVAGFLATSANPMKRVKMLERLKKELEQGLITEDEMKRAMGGGNKFIGTSTAYYQYNHLWRRVSLLIDAIHGAATTLERKGQSREHLITLGGPLNAGQIPCRYMSDGKQALSVFPFYDMSSGFLNMPSIERSKSIMSQYQFDMEYGCFFPPDSEGFFRRSLLDAARKHNSFSPAIFPRTGFTYVMGIDPARVSDNFAASLYEVDMIGRLARFVRMYTWHRRPFPEVHAHLREIIGMFGVKKIKMDAGGGGREMRDLLADPHSCPAGQQLILEKDNSEHLAKSGQFLLSPLVEFSNYEWLQGVNEGMRSALEHGRMLICAEPPVPGELWLPMHDEAAEEIEATLVEASSIITTARGNRMHWDTPQKNQRKDRYTAMLLGYDAARELIDTAGNSGQLAEGFVIYN